MTTGFLPDVRKRKDYSFRLAFGVPETAQALVPLGRRRTAEEEPVLYQGFYPYCVPYSFFWIRRFQGCTIPNEAIHAILKDLDINDRGSKPGMVLEAFRKRSLLNAYFWLDRLDPQAIYRALREGPLAIGLLDWPLVPGGHFLVLLDVTEDGRWLCVNWANQTMTDFVELPMDTPIHSAVLLKEMPYGHGPSSVRLSFFEALGWKVKTLFQNVCR